VGYDGGKTILRKELIERLVRIVGKSISSLFDDKQPLNIINTINTTTINI